MNNHDAKVRQEALCWLQYARDDLDVALQLMESGHPRPRHACWQCQQAAEKAIKAALLYERVEFPFTHDLDVLGIYFQKAGTCKTRTAICLIFPNGPWMQDIQESAQSRLMQTRSRQYPRHA